jgi:hypothetical protein
MMPQIINDPSFGSRLGEALGTGLGGGLHSGLKQLADLKMQQMVKDHESNQFSQKLIKHGVEPKYASILSLLDPKQRAQVMSNGIPMAQQPASPSQGQPVSQGMGQAGETQTQPSTMMFGKSAANTLKEKNYSLAQQKQIDSGNKAWMTRVGVEREKDAALLASLSRARDLLKTGKVATGLAGYKPMILQNSETQEYNAIIDTAVSQMMKGTGPASAFKIKFLRGTKPGITLKREAQLGILDDLEKGAALGTMYAEIRDNLIEKNGGVQPANLEALTNKEMRRIENEIKKAGGLSKVPLDKLMQPDTANQQQPMTQGVAQQAQQVPAQNTPQQPQAQEQQLMQGESPIGEGVRDVTRSAVRGLVDPVLGAVGSTASTILGAGNWATGGRIPTYEDLQDKVKILPPTMGQVEKFENKLTGGYTAPRTENEAWADEFLQTVGSLYTPGKVVGPLAKGLSYLSKAPKASAAAASVILPFSGAMSLKRAVGLSLAGEAGETTGETLGLGSTGKGLMKFGFMVAAGMKGTRAKLDTLRDEKGTEYKQLFKDTKVPVENTLKKMKDFHDSIQNSSHKEKEIFRKITGGAIREIEDKTKGGQAPVNDLIKAEQNINTWWDDVKQHGDLKRFTKIVQEPIEQASLKNPEAGKAYAAMKDLHGALKSVDKAKAIMKDNLSLKANWSAPLRILINGGPEYAAAVARLMASSTAQGLYMGAIKSALKENAPALTSYMTRLDKELR